MLNMPFLPRMWYIGASRALAALSTLMVVLVLVARFIAGQVPFHIQNLLLAAAVGFLAAIWLQLDLRLTSGDGQSA